MANMEVIALRGEPNCGKTETLHLVYRLLSDEGWQQVENSYKDLCNRDFLDVLKKGDRILGIVTQGDYAIGNYSVRNHLRTLEEKDCDIAVCACTIGEHKQKIQNAITSYPKYHFIDKRRCEDGILRKDDSEKAMEITTLLNSIINME